MNTSHKENQDMLCTCPEGLSLSSKTPFLYLACPQGLLFLKNILLSLMCPQGLLFSSKLYFMKKYVWGKGWEANVGESDGRVIKY